MSLTSAFKDYYLFYGIKDEGPYVEIQLDKILSNSSEDLLLLDKLLCSNESKKDFTKCKVLIDEISNGLSNRGLLIEELQQIKNNIHFDIDGISNGIIWFQQAQELSATHNESDIEKIAKDIKINSAIVKGSKIQGSLILQLYIALVYMREGPISQILKIGSDNRCKTMNLYKKLLNCDYIRHIRNSLSHGSFKINIAGVNFKDEEYEIVATPGFLDSICIWIFVLYYNCILFIQNELS